MKMFFAVAALLAVAASVQTAEIRQQTTDKGAFKPDLKTAPVDNQLQKEAKDDLYPVFQDRANIALVKSDRPAVRHDMLADQPIQGEEEIRRQDTMAMPSYGFAAPAEVYSDVPYAPGYPYDHRYDERNSYENYNTGLSNFMLEPDTSVFSLLWHQMPDARAIVGFMGRTIAWALNGFFVVLLGSFLTMGLCTYTNMCTLTFHGIGTIEEMRSLMSPEKLHKISNAADFVKSAIDKYEKIQDIKRR